MQTPKLLLATALSFAIFAGCAEQKSDTIKIGEYASLTGATASFGQNAHNGTLLAIEEINAAGGILGKQIELITEDDQSKPEEGAIVVNKLIHRDGVVAVLGEVASSISLAGAPICQENKIPMITPASTNPKVTQVGDYIFRVCFIDPFQGKVLSKFANENLKVSKVALLTDIKNDYSVGLAKYFKESFTANGGEVVAEQIYSASDKDFKAQLTALKSVELEAICIPGYYTEVGLIARQARELGIDVPLFGGDGWSSARLTEIGGEALNNCYFVEHFSQKDPNPIVQDFVTKYQAKYNALPDGMGALGYDSAKILANAIKNAGEVNSEKIKNALAKTNGYKGVTGTININPERNATKSAVILQIKDNEFEYFATVNP
ncbi:MAG: ethanolamine utilization protein EutJ [Calditrichaeota bacterium]|nr:MAG: ethanolamine utilization protein EutJ [Calditrichota bacterium]